MCDSHPDLYDARRVHARKQYRCTECSGRIAVGTLHEYVFGVWEGDSSNFRTCLACCEVRDWLCKQENYDCHVFGELREELSEFARNAAGDARINAEVELGAMNLRREAVA